MSFGYFLFGQPYLGEGPENGSTPIPGTATFTGGRLSITCRGAVAVAPSGGPDLKTFQGLIRKKRRKAGSPAVARFAGFALKGLLSRTRQTRSIHRNSTEPRKSQAACHRDQESIG